MLLCSELVIEKEIAHSALDYFGIRNLEHRIITSLSGGERERVALSTLMVQDPNIWLLDEPTNHLDPRHQLEVLKILDKQSENGRIIITTGHNPALAMQFAKQVLLLFGNGEWEYGSADELLEPNRLERLYQMPFEYYINEIDKQKVLLPS